MSLKKIIFLVFLIGTIFISTRDSLAAIKIAAPKVSSRGVVVTTSLRGKKSVRVYFKNLNNAKSVSYVLSYKSKQGPQGALGTIATKGKFSLTRELLFGTCSNKVCRYDTNIKDCMLVVTSKLKNGKTDIKRIKLRV